MNVLWELKTALIRHRPESVPMTFGYQKGMREELPDSVRAQLEKELGREILARLRLFYYPAEQPSPGASRDKLYETLSQRLFTALCECIQDSGENSIVAASG